MNLRQIRDLRDRVSNLAGDSINRNRRPLYRYQYRGFDVVENEAWRWFVEMQLTSLELDEVRTIDKRRKQLGYASSIRPCDPEKAAIDRALYNRWVELLEIAELRAEEILEQQSQHWHSWLRYFQQNVYPELEKPIDVEVHEDEVSEYLWDFKLRHIDAYKEETNRRTQTSQREKNGQTKKGLAR
jgi:hypothetical protein